MTEGPKHTLVVDIKRNSLDDGPGIRSVVFFKGCTLRCAWCQNPEALSPLPEIQIEPGRCLGCLDCQAACPEGVAAGSTQNLQDNICKVCGLCVEACPNSARRVAGRTYPAAELVELLARDEPFYRHSGGGVTLSGGEPAMFPAYAGKVARGLSERGIHVLIETAGHVDFDGFEEHLLQNVSTVYFDLKIADPARHERYVGVDNSRILGNLARLVASGVEDLLCRVPLIPGLTDGNENLSGLARILAGLGQKKVALLPYNPLWVPKARALGRELKYAHDSFMSEDELTRCRSIFEDSGIEVV